MEALLNCRNRGDPQSVEHTDEKRMDDEHERKEVYMCKGAEEARMPAEKAAALVRFGDDAPIACFAFEKALLFGSHFVCTGGVDLSDDW